MLYRKNTQAVITTMAYNFCSRPKRICKDQANRALGLEFEEEEEGNLLEAFDNESDEQPPINDEIEDAPPDDDILRNAQLARIASSGDESSDSESSSVELSDGNSSDNSSEGTPADYISPSGRLWHQNNPTAPQGRQPARNVFRFAQGPAAGINPTTERESMLMYLEYLLTTALQYSNLQGRRLISTWNRSHPNNRKIFKPIDLIELEAFVGLLVLLGAFRSRYRDISELWSIRDGFPVCRATMTRERFMQIKSVLRFDDPLRRDRTDTLAPVRAVFEQFNLRLRQLYIPSPYLTIDEQLLEFHGRVRFKQYIQSKPGKFGIKLLWLCCAETFYVLNGVVYIGVGTISPNERVTTYDVSMHLMNAFLNTGRHLTGDNWFTSLELVDDLKSKDTSYIGTVRNNNRGVPPVAKSTENRQRKDTKVFYDEHGTALVSFWDKGTKPVLLVDTLHRDVPVPEINTKACTVLEYNRTKSGVDIADKRIKGLSCKRKCRRWPYSIFSNMVDIAGNNGSIVYHERYPGETRRQQQHYTFLRNAGYQLVDRHIRRRLQQPTNLRQTTKMAMHCLGYEIPAVEHVHQVPRLEKSKRCAFCPVRSDRKTFVCCPRCGKPRCNDHRSDLCKNCI